MSLQLQDETAHPADVEADAHLPEFDVPVERYPRARAIAVVRELSRVSAARSILVIGLNWGVIAVAAWAAVSLGTWWAYLLAIVVIATRQQALGVLVHDGAHYLLFRNHTVNDIVSDVFLAFPIAMSTTLYRKTHFLHHRFTNTEQDPDLIFEEKDPAWWDWPKTRLGCALLQLKALVGLNPPGAVKILKQWNPLLNLFSPITAAFPLRARILFVASSIVFYALIIHFHLIVPAILLWVVPSVTLVNFLNHWRAVSEHIATQNTHELNSTRTVVATWLEKLTVAPHGINYHLEHHLYPSVPGPNLKHLHKALMEDEEYREKAIVSPSYWGLLKQLMRQGNPKVQPRKQK